VVSKADRAFYQNEQKKPLGRESIMEQFLPLIMSAVGGGVLGPLVAKVLKGNVTGGVLGGLLGGVATHFGLNAADVGPLLAGDGAMAMIDSLLKGGVGGGVLGTVAGMIMKAK
jgi:hypothetical protein